jgi:hypothetical protein
MNERNPDLAHDLLIGSGIDIITIGSEMHLEIESTGDCTKIYQIRLEEKLLHINKEIDMRLMKRSKLNFLEAKIKALIAQLSSIDKVTMGIDGLAKYYSKLLLEEIIGVLQEIQQDITNEEVDDTNSKVDSKKDRQNDYNKPGLDLPALVLLAECLKENEVFLKDIKKGEIAEGMAALTGYSFDHLRNMQTPGKREDVLNARSIRQIEKLIEGLTSHLELIKK